MSEDVQFLSPFGMLRWLLRSTSTDQLSKRFVLFAAALYATGVFVKNVDLLGMGIHNLNPARASTILVGCLALAVNIVAALICLAATWLLRRFKWMSSPDSLPSLLALLVNTLLISGTLLLILHEAYLHLSWVFDPASVSDPKTLVEFFCFGLVIAVPVAVDGKSPPERAAHRGALVFALSVCFLAFVWMYQDLVYEALPQWLGGGHFVTLRFVIKQDAIDQVRVAGLTTFSDGVTPAVQIVDSDDGTFTLYGSRIVQLAKAGSTKYPYSFTVNKDQIQSVIYKPVDWSWEMFSDDRCWVGLGSDAQLLMGTVTVQGLPEAESRQLLSKWTLSKDVPFDGCYPYLFLKQEAEGDSRFRGYDFSWNGVTNKKTNSTDVTLIFARRS